MEEQADPPETATEGISPPSSEGLVEILGQLAHWLGRGSKDGLGRSARASRKALERHQSRRDLDRLYQKLGRETIRLIEAGEISHPGLEARIPRIRAEQARVNSLDQPGEDEE
jgi:hypothetical protein